MPQGKFWTLQLPKAGCRAKHTHCKKQHQQTIAKAYQSVVDTDNDCPDFAAAKGFRRLRHERPDFVQVVIPVGKRVFKGRYDPVITHMISSPFLRIFYNETTILHNARASKRNFAVRSLVDRYKILRYTYRSDRVADARGACNRGSPCGGSLFHT